jgi:succinate dehydrogenase/fumarate reductase cytochrome b subunit
MILGMSTSSFTLLHVVLSLIGIAAGFVVVVGMFGSKTLNGWTALFLATTILTSVTGFLFPSDKILPSHIVGGLSLVVLIVAVLAFYRYRLEASWRWIYVVTALAALYFNVFVGVVQAFQKIPALNALAPTQSDPAFVIVQLVVLVAFVAVGVGAVRSFHPGTQATELRPR